VPDIAVKPLPFEEAIRFFRDKVVLTPDKFNSLTAEAKAKAFSVSGVSKMNVLEDLFTEAERGLSEGTSFGEFKKGVKGVMEKRGWEGAAPYRLDTIFRNNIQTAYQAGHYRQQMEVAEDLPYWEYVAVMDSRTRPVHRMMNGKIFKHDDPFWKSSYPPNGFNCRCTVRALTEGQVKREELTVGKNGTGISDKGWDVNPGEVMGKRLPADQFKKLQSDPKRWTPLINKGYADYGMTSARDFTDYRPSDTELWPRGKKAVEMYKANMMGKVFEDAVKEPLIMNEELIKHIKLDGREQYLPLIEDIVTKPQEIWLQAEKEKLTNKVVLRKRYVSLIQTGKERPLLLVAEASKGQWLSYTIFQPGGFNYVDGLRQGVLLYGK